MQYAKRFTLFFCINLIIIRLMSFCLGRLLLVEEKMRSRTALKPVCARVCVSVCAPYNISSMQLLNKPRVSCWSSTPHRVQQHSDACSGSRCQSQHCNHPALTHRWSEPASVPRWLQLLCAVSTHKWFDLTPLKSVLHTVIIFEHFKPLMRELNPS